METPSFEIEKDSNLPYWVQLKERFVYLINSGYYQPGDQLPTVRKFAADLRIAYNTVSKAYMALERDGFITTSRGRGAFVCEPPGEDGPQGLDLHIEEFVRGCLERGMDYDDISRQVHKTIEAMRRSDTG